MTIPADTFLCSKDFADYKDYLKLTEELIKFSESRTPLPVSFEQSYILTNPLLYLTYSHLGDYYSNMKDYNKAYGYYQNALSREVAGAHQRENLDRLSKIALKKADHTNDGN